MNAHSLRQCYTISLILFKTGLHATINANSLEIVLHKTTTANNVDTVLH